MDYFVKALQEHQELAIFLCLAVGFFIGRIKIGSFSLGTVVGTLLAGVIIGQLDIKVSPVVKNVFFDLFLFTTGYKVGPQFFRGLKKDALPQLAVTVVLCVTCLLAAFVAAKILGYDMGTTAGLLAGAFTESTVIGTAGDAINRLSISAAEKTALMNNIPVAYAVTYLIGTAFIVWFLPNIGPKLMGVNLKEEGRKLQAKISTAEEPEAGVQSAFQNFGVRAYRVTNQKLLEQDRRGARGHAQGDARLHLPRSATKARSSSPSPRTVIHAGDVIAVMTRTELLMDRGTEIGPEVDDKALLDFPQEYPGRGDHEQGPGREDPQGAGGLRVHPRGFPAEAPAGGGADALHHRDPHRPGRCDEPRRRQARRGTGGEGAGVCGPAGDHAPT